MKLRYKVLTLIAVSAAVATVLPASASKPCLLGYYAHCSWTPVSTLICMAIADAIYWFGLRRAKL